MRGMRQTAGALPDNPSSVGTDPWENRSRWGPLAQGRWLVSWASPSIGREERGREGLSDCQACPKVVMGGQSSERKIYEQMGSEG